MKRFSARNACSANIGPCEPVPASTPRSKERTKILVKSSGRSFIVDAQRYRLRNDR